MQGMAEKEKEGARGPPMTELEGIVKGATLIFVLLWQRGLVFFQL